jgi:hypothetical protein
MRDVRSMTGTAGLRRVADFEAILLAIAGLDLREPRRGSRFSISSGYPKRKSTKPDTAQGEKRRPIAWRSREHSRDDDRRLISKDPIPRRNG